MSADLKHPEFVEWLDSAGPHGWVCYEPGASKPAMVCWTVGYVVQETVDEIVISGSLGFDGPALSCVNSPLSIPQIAIRRRVVLSDGPAVRQEGSTRLVKAEAP